MNYISKSAGLAFAAALVSMSPLSLSAADKYLQSLEDRIAALEAEVNATQTDAKGKGVIEAAKIPVYVTPKSKYVEELKLRGRLQWQWGYSFAHNGGTNASYSTFETRRARIGVEGKLANDFRFMVELNAGGAPGVGLNEYFIQYMGYDYARPLVGRVKPRFGYEENTSSAKILTVERSRITNLFATSYITGAVLDGEYSVFNYSMGIFNATNGGSAGTDVNPVGFNNQDYLYNVSVGLDFSELVGTPLEFRADYMNFTTNPLVVAPNPLNLQQNLDVSMRVGFGPFDLRAEWYYGFDSNATNLAGLKNPNEGDSEYVWAVVVEPSIFVIADKLQLVSRFEYGSSGYRVIRTTTRYENRLPGAGTPGTEYWAVYGGLQYFINGDDLKLMAGYYYSKQNDGIGDGLGDRDANTFYTAVRMQF